METKLTPPLDLQTLRDTFTKIRDELYGKEEQIANMALQGKIETKVAEQQLERRITLSEARFEDKAKRVIELEEALRKQSNESRDTIRKETRKYLETIIEKQNQIEGLRKQVLSYKNKANLIQNELANTTSARESLDSLIAKNIEQVKLTLKELSHSYEEANMQRILIESKCRQMNQRIDTMARDYTELEAKKQYLSDSHEKLKSGFKSLESQNINLKFEVEELRFRLEKEESTQKKEVLPALAQESLLALEAGKISELVKLLRDRNEVNSQLRETNRINVGLFAKNKALEERTNELQFQVDKLTIHFSPSEQNEILSRRCPSLLTFLKQKQAQIHKFESQLQKIETYIEEKDEAITAVLYGPKESTQDMEAVRLKTKCNELEGFLKQANLLVCKRNEELAKATRMLQTYKMELASLIYETDGATGKRRSRKKKTRCDECLLPYEKEDQMTRCEQCSRLYHPQCFVRHRCEEQKKPLGQFRSSDSAFK